MARIIILTGLLPVFLAGGMARMHASLPRLNPAQAQSIYKIKTVRMRPRMRDGVELAAKIVMPDADGKFPAIMGYTPYRMLPRIKDTPSELEYAHPLDGASYFAQRGYAVLEFDPRGTGGSGGFSDEMYSDAERRDAYDMVEWIAAQAWCNGNVGMWGVSYGGVDTLQVAATAPPHLKAVIVRSGTDDVYGDWTYPGGAMRPYIYATYAPQMTAMNFAPPNIETVGEKWDEVWKEHLEKDVPWGIGFIKHQFDDDFWRVRSVRPDYDRIKCAVFLIAGWADWYPTAELRTFSHLKVPKKALVGPWAHYWPENAFPGPRIDGRREYLKWFDHWLKGVDTGVMKEPPVTLFVRQWSTPEPEYLEDKGFWRRENEWPLARTEKVPMFFGNQGTLTKQPLENVPDTSDPYDYSPVVGIMSGIYGRGNVQPFAMPLDQRADEAYSVTYTTSPLSEDSEVTGDPAATLYVSSSADRAFFEVKLCDVAPDGTSRLVSDGGLNATQRSSRMNPEALEPGKVYKLEIALNSMAYVFPAGHRIRVDISSADFQNAWPVSRKARNAVHRGSSYPSRIVLPFVSVQRPALPPPAFEPSPNPLPGKDKLPKPSYYVIRDFIHQTTTVEFTNDPASPNSNHATYTISETEPADVNIKGTVTYVVARPEGDFKVEAQCITTSDAATFRHLVELEITVNGKLHFNKSWSTLVPRKFN